MNCSTCEKIEACKIRIGGKRAAVLAAAQGEQPEDVTRALDAALMWADEFLTEPSGFRHNLALEAADTFFKQLRKAEAAKRKAQEEAAKAAKAKAKADAQGGSPEAKASPQGGQAGPQEARTDGQDHQ